MEFCPQCDSLFDITNNLDEVYTQKGGNKFDNLFDLILNNNNGTNDNEIKHILADHDSNTIKKSNEYQSLDLDQQELIYNKIQSLFSKKKKNIKKKTEKSSNSPVYYTCVDCKYTVPLKSGVNIYSEIKNKQNVEDYSHYIHSNIHSYTTEYNCINTNCKSHETGGEAIYFRNNNKIMLICKVCNFQFYKN